MAIALDLYADHQRINDNENNNIPNVDIIRKLRSANDNQHHKSGAKAERDLFKRTTRKLCAYLGETVNSNAFPLPEWIVKKISDLHKIELGYDLKLLPVLQQSAKKQGYGKVKAHQVVSGLLSMGFTCSERTMNSKLLKLMRCHGFRIEVPGFGIIKGLVDDDKIEAGVRTRCDEYEIVKNC